MFDEVRFVYRLNDNMQESLRNIDNKLGKIVICDRQKVDSLIIKTKARMIHASLSIEGNTLSLFDVEKICENSQVIRMKNEVQEVRNALELYDNIKGYDYKSEEDFLKAHSVLMQGLNSNGGEYRNHGEGIQKNGYLIYQAPDSLLVPSLMHSLFDLLKNESINKIVLAALFHYYSVTVHPFTDGNGRMARFWINLILISYNEKFEFIPIDEEIYLNQGKYYEAIDKSHNNENANEFITFMLKSINLALDKIIFERG